MTVSYVVASVCTALLLELLLALLFFLIIIHTPAVDQNLLETAQHSAQVYALEAAVQANGDTLDSHSTFQPGQPSSLTLPGESPSTVIPYVTTSSPHSVGFALLITSNSHILASSYPAQYPVSATVESLLPGQARLISNALAGRADSIVETTNQGNVVSAVCPVWNKEKKVIGAIYLQMPPTAMGGNILAFAEGWLSTALLWLVIMAPAGAFFGVLTTRGVVRRLHRLVQASARFAGGDYTQQVPVTKRDEIGQLELQFNQMAQQLVASIAQQQTLVEQHARREERTRIEQELRTAQLIQRSLLPKEHPHLSGWHIATYYQSAREVGGDLYDFIPFEDGRLGLIIGDVADKGMAAALVMASTRSMLRAAAQVMDAPGEVLAHVNELLYADTPPKMFVTCFYAVLNPKSGILRYANAGHDLPYRCAISNVAELEATGMPLGLMPGMVYEEQEVTIAPGEHILFYSDGLVEAHNAQRDMFGFSRLQRLLQEHSDGGSLIDFLLDKLKGFTGERWEQEDDMTLLTLQRAAVSSSPSIPDNQQETQNTPVLLREWTLPSTPDNEQQAVEQVATAVRSFYLPSDRLDNLKTAVAEAVMNAMEHGNQYQPDKPVTLQVLASETMLVVRVRDLGTGHTVPASVAVPDLDARLHGELSPRGWGLFLMKSLVDELHTSNENNQHTVELIVYR